jgi:hypothetical protein
MEPHEEAEHLEHAVSDRLIDAATGQPVAGSAPADLAPVRLNNRLRGIVQAALGSLTLMAPDPGRRYDSAQAVFKSRDASVLPAIDKALAAETNTRVKRALAEARAAIILTTDDASAAEKVAAIAVIRDRGDQDALGLIQGLPGNLPPEVQTAVSPDRLRSLNDELLRIPYTFRLSRATVRNIKANLAISIAVMAAPNPLGGRAFLREQPGGQQSDRTSGRARSSGPRRRGGAAGVPSRSARGRSSCLTPHSRLTSDAIAAIE